MDFIFQWHPFSPSNALTGKPILGAVESTSGRNLVTIFLLKLSDIGGIVAVSVLHGKKGELLSWKICTDKKRIELLLGD